MPGSGWKRLMPNSTYLRGEGAYPIEAYSEFVPPRALVGNPYGDGGFDPAVFDPLDPFGWRISEYEEAREIRPGLPLIAQQVVGEIGRLLDGDPDTDIRELDLTDNPYWPPELGRSRPAARALRRLAAAGPVAHAGRQGPRALDALRRQRAGPGQAVLAELLHSHRASKLPRERAEFLFSISARCVRGICGDVDEMLAAGFRILPVSEPLVDYWDEGPLPSWTEPFVLGDRNRSPA